MIELDREALEAASRLYEPSLWAKVDKYADDNDWNGGTAANARHMLMEKMEAAIRAYDQAKARPTHRNIEHGINYRFIGYAEMRASEPVVQGDLLAIYCTTADNRLWARHSDEFNDGQFQLLPAPPDAKT